MSEELKPVQVLFNQLVDASKHYDRDHQMGSNMALESVIEFLYCLNFPSPVLMPLHGLSSALVDAGQGITNPHTAVKKQTGGPRTPIWEANSKSTAAAAISLLIEAGDELEAAAKKVSGKLGHVKGMDKTLRTYRKHLTREGGKVRQEGGSLLVLSQLRLERTVYYFETHFRTFVSAHRLPSNSRSTAPNGLRSLLSMIPRFKSDGS